MGHDNEANEGLVPTYKTQRPPWIGLWSDREYKGKPEWWKENGLNDEVVRAHHARLVGSSIRETDPDWYDRKVPDGTSNAGPLGLDSRKNKNTTIKADTAGDLAEFQKKVHDGSHQYKAIAEKFGLSKEHPGLAVNPTLNDLINTPLNKLGRSGIFPNSWYHFGPRFFDKPLNEGSFMKGLACAKYAGIILIPYTICEIRAYNTVKVADFSPRTFFKRYLQLSPLPISYAFTWGFILSAAAGVRRKDDVYNHFYASAASGVVMATFKDSIGAGVTAALITTILGVFWQYSRVVETGTQGRTLQPQSGGIWGGPFAWKLFQHGDHDVPTIKY